MGDVRPLLAQLSWRFHPRMEALAVEALAYIFNRYPESREGLQRLLKQAVPGMSLSVHPFKTQAVKPDGTRPDVLQKGDDGEERLFIEAKFYAPLTPSQPVSYLKWLPDTRTSVLMFLAPSGRLEELWPELLARLAKNGVPHSDVGSRCVVMEGTGKHLLITDWTRLLDEIEERLKDSRSGMAEFQQLRGLVWSAESVEEPPPPPGKELVDRVTEIGKKSGWLDTSGLIAAPFWHGFGRYVRLGRRYKVEVWLGVHSDLDGEFGSTHLWVRHWGDKNLNPRVRAALKRRVSPFKEEAKALWVAVVAEKGKRADKYAAALERIAGILDELAEPWGSRADVLEEINRPYEQPVMSNPHCAEYVKALLALALRDTGWTREQQRDAWDFESESGVRLKLKHAAAMQSWGHREPQNPPRFVIAPGEVYRDEKEAWRLEHHRRLADIYVFAWHGDTGDSADQRDPASWEFCVVPASDLPAQKTVALKAVRDLTSPCGIGGLAAAVEALSGERR